MLAAVVAAYCVIFGCTMIFGWMPTWSAVGVEPMSLPFGDLRAITGATTTIDRGLDPLTDNVGDPWGRPANYPRVWMNTAHALRLTPATTDGYGVVLLGCFIASLVILAPLITSASDAIVVFLFAVTPATLLAVERGKIEFVLLALVCGVTAARRSWMRVVLLSAATLLKLFPVFALGALTLTRRGARRYGIIALAVIGAWAYHARTDLRLIQSSIPVDSRTAYGLSSLAFGISHALGGRHQASWALAVFSSAAAAVSGWWLARVTCPTDGSTEPVSERRAVGLILAASIYIGTFLAASNYDYRLIFLLTALPFLNASRNASAAAVSWTATVGTALIFVAMSEVPLRTALGHAGSGINDVAKIATIGTLVWGLTVVWLTRTRGGVPSAASASRSAGGSSSARPQVRC